MFETTRHLLATLHFDESVIEAYRELEEAEYEFQRLQDELDEQRTQQD